MKKLLEKELELIKHTLKNQVSLVLKHDFETNCGSEIFKVLGVNIGEIVVDTHNSNFREDIVIRKMKMKARVKLHLNCGAFKEATIPLKLHNDIHLTFNKSNNEYRILNGNHIKIMDLNPN
jgi:hypothetical protein